MKRRESECKYLTGFSTLNYMIYYIYYAFVNKYGTRHHVAFFSESVVQ